MTQPTSARRHRSQPSRSLAAFRICSLVAVSVAWSASVHADRLPDTPLVAMRAAAQESADVEPGSSTLTRRGSAPAIKIASDSLHVAIQAAVHDEAEQVARTGTLTPGRSDNTQDTRKGNGSATSDRRDPSEMGQLHTTVKDAQQAKRSIAVESQHQGGGGSSSAGSGHVSAPLLGAGGKR